jgi:pyruvate formate lyase activating enzyme
MVHLGKTVGGAACRVCGGASGPVSGALGVCLDCIRGRWDESLPHVEAAHEGARRRHDLPGRPPKTDRGIPCSICSNGCVIGEGEKGYCGLRWNDGGLRSLTDAERGLIYTYLDPHVTNCCSAWFCPGGTGAGYPEYAHRRGPELGHANLAAFLYGCNFDCLFCQNASHKDFRGTGPTTAEALARRVEGDPRISCVCYFGGSPEPQLPFALRASEMMLEARRGEPFRVCFEWNGCGDPSLARRAAELSLESGGNIKFDLKCSTPELSLSLSGVPNERAYENFEMIAGEYYPQREGLPMLTATTLLVPGYVNATEVEAISRFIADLDPSIPYGLLAFHPKYQMADLPFTPLRQAVECYRAARRNLERVHVGNLPLLGLGSMAQFTSIALGQ